jgi:hypothetical protein
VWPNSPERQQTRAQRADRSRELLIELSVIPSARGTHGVWLLSEDASQTISLGTFAGSRGLFAIQTDST